MTEFTFSALAGAKNHQYELKLDLFEKVNVEESKLNVGVRSIFCVIVKAENGWWKNLLRGSEKPPHYLKIDWDKWVDGDKADETPDVNTRDMDFSVRCMGGMGDMGGMDGMGGMGCMDVSSLMQGMGGMDMSGMGDMGDMGDESDDDDNEVEKPGEVEVAAKDVQKIEASPSPST
ncbi:hypothetical protein MKX03_006382 [Papaver bracteatum]|nr:hypothetical protein MKX03_006382 [Papaver bracteatum]